MTGADCIISGADTFFCTALLSYVSRAVVKSGLTAHYYDWLCTHLPRISPHNQAPLAPHVHNYFDRLVYQPARCSTITLISVPRTGSCWAETDMRQFGKYSEPDMKYITKPHTCVNCRNIVIREADLTEKPHEIILFQGEERAYNTTFY